MNKIVATLTCARAHKAYITQLILRSVRMTVINGGMATDETDELILETRFSVAVCIDREAG